MPDQPGSHRADMPARGARSRVVGLVVVAVVLVAAIIFVPRLWGGWGAGDDTGGAGSSGSTAPSTPTGTPSSHSSPSTSPSTSPSRSPSTAASSPSHTPTPAAHLARLPDEPPHRLVVGDLVDTGFDTALTTTHGRLIPPGARHAVRLEHRGEPGSPGKDTVVVVGAATDAGTGAFDRLGEAHDGSHVDLQTATGTLTYTIRSHTTHDPDTVLSMSEVAAHAPGRLVLVVAHYDNGNRVGDDEVLVAELTKVSSTRP